MQEKTLTKFEKEIHEWLTNEVKDIETGALLMLQANRNQILYQNVLRKNNIDKIEYELRKYMADAYRECSQKNVDMLENKMKNIDIDTLPKGQRPDHNTLPEEIQNLYQKNIELYNQIRSRHERLKVLTAPAFTSCDRFPILKELVQKDEELRKNWDRYDNYTLQDDTTEKNESQKLSVQEVNKHRTYISRAIKEAKQGKDIAKKMDMLKERVNELVADKQNFDEETINELKQLGLDVKY